MQAYQTVKIIGKRQIIVRSGSDQFEVWVNESYGKARYEGQYQTMKQAEEHCKKERWKTNDMD